MSSTACNSAAPESIPPEMDNSLLAAQRRERDKLLAELVTIQGFMPLLMKHRTGGKWTAAERAQLAAQFRAMAHISPYLAVLILPGSVFVLPWLAWWLDRRRRPRGTAKAG